MAGMLVDFLVYLVEMGHQMGQIIRQRKEPRKMVPCCPERFRLRSLEEERVGRGSYAENPGDGLPFPGVKGVARRTG